MTWGAKQTDHREEEIFLCWKIVHITTKREGSDFEAYNVQVYYVGGKGYPEISEEGQEEYSSPLFEASWNTGTDTCQHVYFRSHYYHLCTSERAGGHSTDMFWSLLEKLRDEVG